MVSGYKAVKSSEVPQGTFGIFQVGNSTEYGMVVESSSNNRNDVVILSEKKVRITQNVLEMVVVPDLSIEPIVERNTIRFREHNIFLGAIRIVDGHLRLVASDGEYFKLVDLQTGKTEQVHSHEAPMITKWDLVKIHSDGTKQVLMNSPEIEAAI